MTPGNARDASSPLDGVMPGLEENMAGEVIDLRPDRFLRELREHGSLGKACINSGMSIAEFNDLCKSNIKFDRAQVECFLQHIEDKIMAVARKQLGDARIKVYAELQRRHGTTVPKTFGKRGASVPFGVAVLSKGGDDDKNCG